VQQLVQPHRLRLLAIRARRQPGKASLIFFRMFLS
jgi:hypothetical protein